MRTCLSLVVDDSYNHRAPASTGFSPHSFHPLPIVKKHFGFFSFFLKHSSILEKTEEEEEEDEQQEDYHFCLVPFLDTTSKEKHPHILPFSHQFWKYFEIVFLGGAGVTNI